MRSTIVALLASVLAASSIGAVDARMFRFPDVSESSIAFVYAGDIWVVGRNGGAAQRLSSPPGEESFPRFSPDGSRIAFSGNYDGNVDLYVVPSGGGLVQRVTYHPGADRMLNWSPDGSELLFASPRESGIGANRLFRIGASGGLAQALPVPYGEFGAFSADGKKIAYTPKSRGFRTWKRYRGGLAPDIWLFDLETLDAENLTQSDANDSQPMWHGDNVFFLSDRGTSQRANLWVRESEGSVRQVTEFTEFDISFPAIGPRDIVFQAGGRLYLLDLATEKLREVDVEVATDLGTLRPHRENVSRLIQSAQISATGKRALIEARGDVFTLPSEHGVIRNLTRTSGIAERYPAWSPDGSVVAYWSDRTGEYELTTRAADGVGEETKLTELGAGYRYRLFWSPDSRKLAFIDQTQAVSIFDRDREEIFEIDHGLFMLHPDLQSFEVSWSADSRWLTWSRGIETQNSAIFLYDTDKEERHQVTSGYYSDSSPVFDPEGNYLYYLSNRALAPIYSDLDATWIYPNTTRLAAVTLRRDVPSPLLPRNDDEEEDTETEEAEQEDEETDAAVDGSEAETDSEDSDKVDIEIEIDGFETRSVVLPPEAGNYSQLRAVSGKVLYHRQPRSGAAADSKSPLLFYDLEEREEKTILGDVEAFELSADGKKILVAHDRKWSIVEVSEDQKLDTPLRTAELVSTIDPRAEWRQLFADVWRAYRDHFYDPNLHGLDWKALRDQYGSLLEDAVTRWDVNFVLGEMIGEVNASHTYVGGGRLETADRRPVGLLGIDWELEDGAYRVARLLEGGAWDTETRSPLREPGIDVSEGDFVLAVNGRPLDPSASPYAAFEGLAGKTVSLTVNDRPTTEGSREVLVETLSSERALRARAWIEGRRRTVSEASDGRIGYVYVPNTGLSGQTELVRQFRSQIHNEGLIIDERFNAGGQLPDRFIEQFNRELVVRIHFRHGATLSVPAVNHLGPKAMLINGWAGSGGDAFPFFFKNLGVGPLIGERTWGGLIGPAVGHSLIDGGFFTAPAGRLYGADGEWFPEGRGVEPDLPVVDDPGAMARGGDPQLEAAISEVLRLLESEPNRTPDPPPLERRIPTN